MSAHPYLVQNGLLDHRGFLPHRECIEALFECDVSALLLDDSQAAEGAIPAKTFEYLRVGNPILLLHRRNGFLDEIIRKTRSGITVDIVNHDGIVDTLLKLQRAWQDQGIPFEPNWDEIRKFDRKHQSRMLTDMFNTLL
jgi:hypothetical protein